MALLVRTIKTTWHEQRDRLDAMQFPAAQVLQVRSRRPIQRPLRVTVTVRYLPLAPAACGTRVARPERTTCPTRRGRRP